MFIFQQYIVFVSQLRVPFPVPIFNKSRWATTTVAAAGAARPKPSQY